MTRLLAAALTGLLAMALVVGVGVAVSIGGSGGTTASAAETRGPGAASAPSARAAARSTARSAARPLAGRVVVLDPGHQLGNARFPRQVNRQVPAGGFRKACNSTGTATNGGFPEATFAWRVSRLVQRRLERLGARVLLTRQVNSLRRWGPCVDVRGRAGNHVGRARKPADLKVSLHADGSYARGARGFHVILPADRRPWTHDIARPSRRLGLDLRRALRAGGFRTATYTAGGDGIDVRADLGTLNLSDIPTVMVELGNMRHRGGGPADGHPARAGGVREGPGGRDPQPPVVTRWAWPDRVIAQSLPSRDLDSPIPGRRSRPEWAPGR